MSRSGAVFALGGSAALLVGCLLFVIVAVTAGGWRPSGGLHPTPEPANPVFGGGDFGDQPGGDPGEGQGGPPQTTVSYSELMNKVKAGKVFDVTQDGLHLQAEAEDAVYDVTLPTADVRVLDDIEAAAKAGGVSPPQYTKVGSP